MDTSCVAYRKLADSTEPGSAQPSKVTTVRSATGVVAPVGLIPANIPIETPSKTIWIPKCDKDSPIWYITLQTRQNGEQFCVVPQSGGVVFDPAKTAPKSDLPLGNTGRLYCECNVFKNVFHGSSKFDHQWITVTFELVVFDEITGIIQLQCPGDFAGQIAIISPGHTSHCSSILMAAVSATQRTAPSVPPMWSATRRCARMMAASRLPFNPLCHRRSNFENDISLIKQLKSREKALHGALWSTLYKQVPILQYERIIGGENTFSEPIACCMSVFMFAPSLVGRHVVIATDNSATVGFIHRGATKNISALKWLKCVFRASLK